MHCNERGKLIVRERVYRTEYTVILARIILKQESGGVRILDRIKARANDVESLLITLRKFMYVQFMAIGAS